MAHAWARLTEPVVAFLHSLGVFPNSDDGPQVIRLACTVLGIALGTSSFAWLLVRKQQGAQATLPPPYAAAHIAETRGVQEAETEVVPEPETTAAPNTDNAAAVEAAPTVVEPHWLMCPITNALFRDPVFVVDSGNTYERDVVLDFWRLAGVAKDPLTNLQLATRDVRTNWGVRREVQSFLDEHPYLTLTLDASETIASDRHQRARLQRDRSLGLPDLL